MKKNIILIFILLCMVIPACEKEDLSYPVAVFDTEMKPRPLYKFTLDASNSFSDKENDYLEYRWDLNGDHVEWETDWLITPTLTIPYPFDGDGIIGLQVKNSAGHQMEIYREIHSIISSDHGYWIYPANSDLSPDFRVINYILHEYTEQCRLSLYWAYDNIVQSSSEDVYNFSNSYQQAKYGSLMNWDRARASNLDGHHQLPTVEEWQHMFDFSCGKHLAGYNLQVEVEHGLNLTCAGIYKDGMLSEFEETGYYWTGDEASENTAFAVKISKDKDEAEIVELEKTCQASVRIMFESYQCFH